MQKWSFLNVRSLFAASFNDILDVIVSANIELVAVSEVSSSQPSKSDNSETWSQWRSQESLPRKTNFQYSCSFFIRVIANVHIIGGYVIFD